LDGIRQISDSLNTLEFGSGGPSPGDMPLPGIASAASFRRAKTGIAMTSQ
jgi:hypothetical protein